MAKLSPTELARRAGISVPYASQLLTGTREKPSLELALQIYDETGLQLGLLKGLKAEEIQVMRKAAA
jgi:transcriptional regulator with XRE-family HTH domain